MTYNKADIDIIKNYKSNNMSNKTIVALINKQSDFKYTESDIEAILSEPETNHNTTNLNNQDKLYNVAADIVFNPAKRKKVKRICLLLAALIVTGFILLGVFVSWTPVIITLSSIIGIILILSVVFFILVKTGVLERMLEKYGF